MLKLLADENFPFDAVNALQKAGYDVVWVRAAAPGISDPEVLNRAQTEGRILITFDKDFGELAFRAKLPAECGVILFRISAPSGRAVAQKVMTAIALRNDWVGHFSVIEDDKIRMRPL